MTEHEIVHVFRGLYGGTVAPDPEEADGYQWASLEEVRADIAAMPERYSVWFRQYIAAQCRWRWRSLGPASLSQG